MRDHTIWRNELISEIRTIADIDELERLWFGINPREISSFVEEVAYVFNDYSINEFISAGPQKAVLTIEQFDALCRFRDRFSRYLEEIAPRPLVSIEHKKILMDPQWHEVIKAAQEFITLLDA
jgi:hypothetical protein